MESVAGAMAIGGNCRRLPSHLRDDLPRTAECGHSSANVVKAVPELIYIKDKEAPDRHSVSMADFIVFRCPHTGMNVQTHLEKQQRVEGRSVEAFTCPACTRVHFLDLTTGQPLSRER